jgi:hypothetical protein
MEAAVRRRVWLAARSGQVLRRVHALSRGAAQVRMLYVGVRVIDIYVGSRVHMSSRKATQCWLLNIILVISPGRRVAKDCRAMAQD